MDNWTALTTKVVFPFNEKGNQFGTRLPDCKEQEGQGQRSKTGFLWIRQATIPDLRKKFGNRRLTGTNGRFWAL